MSHPDVERAEALRDIFFGAMHEVLLDFHTGAITARQAAAKLAAMGLTDGDIRTALAAAH